MLVAVLLGGMSAERAVSLVSGEAVAQAVERLGHRAIKIDAQRDLYLRLSQEKPEIVLNLLHGVWGEDGRVQGVLEFYGAPYSHSGVLASALAMDKSKAKTALAAAGLDVPAGRLVNRFDAARDHALAPPYVVKPNAEGSSVGVFVVTDRANGPPHRLAGDEWTHGDLVLAEEFIPGKELTVAVMGDRALAVTEILPTTAFYDYEAKYASGGSRHQLPADLPASITDLAMAQALAAHQCLGCRGLTRSDFRYDPATGRLVILEVNTQPGMTPTSLAPEQAAYCGISFDALVGWMLEDASCPR